MQRRTFRAMGTDVELLLDAEPSETAARALDDAEREFARLETLLSRFRPDSELSALNEGGVLDAGPDLVAVTRLALEARDRTGGRFDPTVHDALVAAGYDRTFEEVAPDGSAGTPPPCGGAVRVHGRRIELEPGYRLDLGGIAKGWSTPAGISPGAGGCGPWASRPRRARPRSASRTARSPPPGGIVAAGAATAPRRIT